MKKHIVLAVALILVMAVLTGCSGTTVVYTNCTCGADQAGSETAEPLTPDNSTGGSASAVKTGLAVLPSAEGVSATAGEDGSVTFDVTYIAVNLDDNGVITACVIDSLKATAGFDASGAITTDMTADVMTKNELGPAYGMVAWGGAVAEWNEQAAALAAYAVGKTYEEILSGAIDETGYAKDADLATSATMYLGSYVYAIGEAVSNATHLGAQSGDELKLAVISSLSGTDAESITLTSDVAAVTMNGGVITGCVIDSLQAAVNFDGSGTITTDMTAGFPTKTQLGFDYGMVAWAGSTYEWFQQAANFASYVTGKTPAQVAGIAVTESTAPAEADLSASVTIAIGGFQALIAKAAQ